MMRRRVRGEPRLDPIRWPRPGRGTLIRTGVVGALLATAAALMWSHPTGCTTPAGGGGAHAAAQPSTRASAPALAPPGTPPHRAGSPPEADRPGTRIDLPPGAVGVPVPVAEHTALRLVDVGDRVDLLRISGAAARPVRIADAALVLGVAGEDTAPGGLLLALTPVQANAVVSATEEARFAVLVRGSR